MKPEISTMDQLCKSIQTFGDLQMAAENRDKLYRYHDALMQSIYSILDDSECDEATKLETFNTTMEQYTAAMKDLFPKLISRKADDSPKTENTIGKSDPNRFDRIVEVDVGKFNPYHDSRGRFASANSAASFTYRTKDPGKQHMADAAVARERERTKPKSTLTAAASSKCEEIEAKSVKRKTEQISVVDDNGNVTFQKSGGRGSVRFTTQDMMTFSGKTITHNHPGDFGGTFSEADISVFAKCGARSIRAVGAEGTYSLERGSAPRSQIQKFASDCYTVSAGYNSKMKAQRSKLQVAVNKGEMTVDAANKQLGDARTSHLTKLSSEFGKLADQYGLIYTFTPST